MRARRRELGWSQERLAHESAVHVNMVGRVERGQASPTVLMLFRIAGALRIAPSELVADVERQLRTG